MTALVVKEGVVYVIPCKVVETSGDKYGTRWEG